MQRIFAPNYRWETTEPRWMVTNITWNVEETPRFTASIAGANIEGERIRLRVQVNIYKNPIL
jgi:hypothetical protein